VPGVLGAAVGETIVLQTASSEQPDEEQLIAVLESFDVEVDELDIEEDATVRL